MRKLLFALAALAAGCTLASSAPAAAAARNYDCSKPGNANKAACKQSAKPKAATPKAKETKMAAAPKAAAAAKPAAKPAAKVAANDRHYDCSKAGNANKSVCKGATAAAKPASGKPAPKPAAMPKAAAASKAAPAASSENNIAAGAIAQCKDGTYSHAKNHRGACSRHGGVGKWLG